MVTSPRPVAELTPAIRAVSEWLSDFPARGAVIGGIAVGLLGVARMTRDVDALVWVEHHRWEDFVRAATGFGIVPRITDILRFAAESRVLLLQHQPTGVEIDVSLAALPFEDELLDRATEFNVANFVIRLPTVEDLIVMKTIANRSRDWTDIESLIELHPRLDAARILSWSTAFAEILESPEVVDHLMQMLAKRTAVAQSGVEVAPRVSPPSEKGKATRKSATTDAKPAAKRKLKKPDAKPNRPPRKKTDRN